MARGKLNKLRKAERQSAKAALAWSESKTPTSSSSGRPSPSNTLSDTQSNGAKKNKPKINRSEAPGRPDSLQHEQTGTYIDFDLMPDLCIGCEELECNHDVTSCEVIAVSRLVSDLFTSSFRLAAASVFDGMIQNLVETFLKEYIMSLVQSGLSPQAVENDCSSDSTKHLMTSRLKVACDSELPDVILQLAVEDTFDLMCDVASRHGRNLRAWGPPCICSFCECMPCLRSVVETVTATTPIGAPPGVKKVQVSNLLGLIRNLADEGLVNPAWSIMNAKSWANTITVSCQKMADQVWALASKSNPLEVGGVRKALDQLKCWQGIDLYYAVAIHQLSAADNCCAWQTTCGSLEQLGLNVTDLRRRHRAHGCTSGDTKPATKGLLQRLQEIHASFCGLTFGGQTDDVALHGPNRKALASRGRRALASCVRELGNAAYEQKEYFVAIGHYSQAIGYQRGEPILFLNRAACLLRLRKFKMAEEDCSNAIVLRPDNHKAWFRRGISRAEQGDVAGARADFAMVESLQRNEPLKDGTWRRLADEALAKATRLPFSLKNARSTSPFMGKEALDHRNPTAKSGDTQLSQALCQNDTTAASTHSGAEHPLQLCLPGFSELKQVYAMLTKQGSASSCTAALDGESIASLATADPPAAASKLVMSSQEAATPRGTAVVAKHAASPVTESSVTSSPSAKTVQKKQKRGAGETGKKDKGKQRQSDSSCIPENASTLSGQSSSEPLSPEMVSYASADSSLALDYAESFTQSRGQTPDTSFDADIVSNLGASTSHPVSSAKRVSSGMIPAISNCNAMVTPHLQQASIPASEASSPGPAAESTSGQERESEPPARPTGSAERCKSMLCGRHQKIGGSNRAVKLASNGKSRQKKKGLQKGAPSNLPASTESHGIAAEPVLSGCEAKAQNGTDAHAQSKLRQFNESMEQISFAWMFCRLVRARYLKERALPTESFAQSQRDLVKIVYASLKDTHPQLLVEHGRAFL